MKLIVAMLALAVVLAACQDNKETGKPGSGPARSFKTTEDSVSYAIGMNIGRGMRTDSININADILAEGIKDAFANKAGFPDSVAQNVLMSFQQKMMQKQQERMQRQQDSMQKDGEVNQGKAKTFLEENKKKPNVVTLPSGLQYEVITAGTGPTPKATDDVKVGYKGTLLDGTEFDASKAGEPAQFNVSGVIPGWTEALKLMKVGSKWRLWIPPDLAYGMTPPPGGKIPAGSLLVFEVELHEIAKPSEQPQGQPQIQMPQGGGK